MAGTIATLLLALVAPTVVRLAIQIGPADYFALALAFLAAATVLGSSPLRGLASNLRRAIAIGEDNLGVLVQSWFSRVVLLVALLAVVGPPLYRRLRRREGVAA